MASTTIEWTDHSISPIRARSKATGKIFHWCQKVSPGCINCYAEGLANRFGLPPYLARYRDEVEFFLDDAKLSEVLRRRKPTRYFWEDCSDMFGEWVTDEWIDRCFATMALTPQHTHQVLTKRPERMAAYLGPVGQVHAAHEMMAKADGPRVRAFPDFPLPNVWLGVSVEDQQRADERIPHLLRCPAAVRFLSCEPLLGPIDLSQHLHHGPCPLHPSDGTKMASFGCMGCRDRIQWVIVGGESGSGLNARPCDIDSVRSLVEQCQAARVACFVKQLGSRPYFGSGGSADDTTFCDAHIRRLRDRKGGEPSEWPADLRVREFPNASNP